MPLRKGSSRSVISSNIREMMASGHPQNQAVAAALDTARRSKRRRKRYASGGSPTNPALWGVDEEELPAGSGLSPVTSAAWHIAKSVLWDLPHRAIDAAKGTSYGLRREDFTDVPPDYSPDQSKAMYDWGVRLPKGAWQPTDELIGASLEGATNVMGGTALSAPAKAAGEFVAGAGPRDPALWHGISKVRLPKPISEMSAVHAPTQQVNERMINPASLQGGRLLPLLGDRTGANTNLMQVNGYRFADPVPMQGGHGFMAANEGTGAAWASGKPVASGIANRVAREGAEAPVYGVYTAMGERSGDFSHHVSDTLSEMLPHTKISKTARRSFDDDMREVAPDWPGLKNEALRPYLADADGGVRKAFVELMDTAKYQKEGFPSVAEARFATTDPRLLNAKTGDAGLSIAQMEGRTFTAPGQHRTYDTNVGGQYVGGFPASVPKEVMYPDIIKPLEAYRDALPGYKPTTDYLMSRSPKGLPVTQEANQKWVDSVSQHLEGRGFKLGAGANDRRAAALTAANDILAQEKALAPAFYSHIDQSIAGITQPSMTAEQWAGTLANRGVKADEMAARGLDKFLASRSGQPVSKQELLGHLEQNEIQIGSRTYGEPPAWENLTAQQRYDVEAKFTELNGRYPDPREIAGWYKNVADHAALGRETALDSVIQPNKYKAYQLTGGENYREKLLTLPVKGAEDLQKLEVKINAGTATLAERQRYNELADSRNWPTRYQSSHWDEPNVLAHRRTNERDVNGQRSLHIEEIQSDWHQAGRKQGYKQEQPQYWVRNTRSGNNSPFFNSAAEAEAYQNSLPANIRTSTVISQRPKTTGEIPDAPFKKNWHEIVVKDAIREAAERGINRISWTPGAAQAERYDLSKTISQVQYDPARKLLKARDLHDRKVLEKTAEPHEIENYIGKEPAKKLLDAPMNGRYQEIGGDGLKIGGEGMKGFYDKMLPDYLNKIGKPHGVKVQKGATPLDRPGYDIVAKDGSASYATYKGPPTQSQLEQIAKQHGVPVESLTARKNKGSEGPVHYMDIPQSLKDEALHKGFRLGAGATDKRAASLAAVDDILDAERRLAGGTHEPAPNISAAERPAAATDTGQVGPGGGGPAGARSLDEAQAAAARWAGARPTLEGQQGPLKIGGDYFVPGPIGKIHDVAENYMRTVHPDRPYTPPTKYHPIDPEHSKAIAQAYEDMPHTPNDPATKASYDALIDETAKQYQAIKATGLKIEPIPAGMPDPYATNPRLAARDVAENNHLWFFPTEGGFGTVNKITDNPMLRKTGEKIGDHDLLANDMFRVVHDYFGHLKEGHGFRAAGEDNAWRTHAQMYSDLARPAMTTETRGQNSWVNYGPHGEKNRTASGADTTYADQKVGLMPEWTMRDRGSPEPIIAYHGSPHSFDRFSSEHLNKGEGNQAYGQGLYFAGHSPVSEWYRHQLASRRDPILQKYGLDSQDGAQVGMAVAQADGDAAAVAADLRKYADGLRAEDRTDKATQNMIQRAEAKAAYLEDPERAKGHMYEVAINARPEQFLDWDAPLSAQGDVGRRVLEIPEVAKQHEHQTKFLGPDKGLTGASAYAAAANWKRGAQLSPSAEAASGVTAALKRAGVAGIRYLDQFSRAKGGTHNYVTFDDNMISILRKYGIVGIPAAGVLGADGEERRAAGGSVNAALGLARAIKRAKGGKVHIGPIVGDTGGRADKVPMHVPDGSYVIPADIVSGLGEGNTGAGMVQLGKMFPKSKPRIMRETPGAVPILAADGEFVVSPESILDRWDDLSYGHQALDAWVLHERQQLIETLEGLDPPAQD